MSYSTRISSEQLNYWTCLLWMPFDKAFLLLFLICLFVWHTVFFLFYFVVYQMSSVNKWYHIIIYILRPLELAFNKTGMIHLDYNQRPLLMPNQADHFIPFPLAGHIEYSHPGAIQYWACSSAWFAGKGASHAVQRSHLGRCKEQWDLLDNASE